MYLQMYCYYQTTYELYVYQPFVQMITKTVVCNHFNETHGVWETRFYTLGGEKN